LIDKMVSQRHQLVRLTEAGWRGLLVGPDWDEQALECLGHWAQQDLPLVVTRQGEDSSAGLALGLPAPLRWQRRRLAMRVPLSALRCVDQFPAAIEITGLLPLAQQEGWRQQCAALSSHCSSLRVYGSYGWQAITGLDCIGPESDLDLLLNPEDQAAADLLATMLRGQPFELPRLDGEFLFANGTAVAWREWLRWRAGETRQILVKRLAGASLESSC